jgi:hypothetical protein
MIPKNFLDGDKKYVLAEEYMKQPRDSGIVSGMVRIVSILRPMMQVEEARAAAEQAAAEQAAAEQAAASSLEAYATMLHAHQGGDAAMFERMLTIASRSVVKAVSGKRQHERTAAAATAEHPDGAGDAAAEQESSSKRVCT